jgi:malonyl-CoA/methylmalonyl-CoA synthetase
MSRNLYNSLMPASLSQEAIVLTTDSGERWSRAKIEDFTGRVATVLQRSGVKPGERVAVQVDKSPQAVCLYLACLKTGAVYIPLNTAYTQVEVEHILQDASPLVYVGQPSTASEFSTDKMAANLTVLSLDANGEGSLIDAAGRVEPLVNAIGVQGDDLAAILYTSGTTGRPKGAMITHDNLSFGTKALVQLWGITENDVLLHVLPTFHAHGLFIAINTILQAGASTLFLAKFAVDAVIERLPLSTMFMGVPTLYTRLLADPRLSTEVCSGIRLFTSGSAPLSAATFEEFYARTGHKILERYGMTETTIIASNPLNGPRLPGTVGYPLPGVIVQVRDEREGEVPSGAVGELVARGPNVFKGYWQMPEQTAAAFTADGFFRTGDLATLEADGRIAIVGRKKDLIISGGYNVYPQEIENALGHIDGVQDSAVIGVPHPDFGEGVIAIIERKAGSNKLTPESVVTQLTAGVARYKLPKRVFIADKLPRNALGKVQKNELRKTYSEVFKSGLP